MGNKQSCCFYKPPRGSRKNAEEKYLTNEETVTQPPARPPSASNLQHISEREPEGIYYNKFEFYLILFANFLLRFVLALT